MQTNVQDRSTLGFDGGGEHPPQLSPTSHASEKMQKQQEGVGMDRPPSRGDAIAALGGREPKSVSPDPVIVALRAVMQIAHSQAETPCPLFSRAIAQAIRAHVNHASDVTDTAASPLRRRLSQSQEFRAKQLLAGDAGHNASVNRAAQVCALSRGYFIRAFKDTTGETPHRWLNSHRIEKAKELLLGPLPISEIALDCGFADQSHLTRVFARTVGVPPGVWRKQFRGGAFEVPDDLEDLASSRRERARELN